MSVRWSCVHDRAGPTRSRASRDRPRSQARGSALGSGCPAAHLFRDRHDVVPARDQSRARRVAEDRPRNRLGRGDACLAARARVAVPAGCGRRHDGTMDLIGPAAVYHAARENVHALAVGGPAPRRDFAPRGNGAGIALVGVARAPRAVRRGSVLLALLVLPLEMPVLIFGARAVDLAMHGESVAGPLNLLAAMLLLFVSLGPIAMAAAMRISVES